MSKEYIEREKALEKVIEVKHYDPELSGVVLHRYIKEIDLKDIPAADVIPVVHGRWEWFDEETGTPLTGYEREWGWCCSCCKHELPDDYDSPDYHPMLNYCPNCGAKMDKEE